MRFIFTQDNLAKLTPAVRGVSEFLCKRFGLQLTEMRSPN